MSNLLTPAEVEAIRQRAEAASPGPWEAKNRVYQIPESSCIDMNAEVTAHSEQIAWLNERCGPNMEHANGLDADFIAAARTDIPRLLADREVLVKALSDARLLMEQVLDDDEPFLARSSVEGIEKFLEQVSDTGVLAQVEEREP